MRLQITKLWAGHDFAARSCCDLDLQSIDPNVDRDTSFHYGDYFCKIVLKSNFENQTYGADTILLQGHFCEIVVESFFKDHFCELVVKSDFQ